MHLRIVKLLILLTGNIAQLYVDLKNTLTLNTILVNITLLHKSMLLYKNELLLGLLSVVLPKGY